MRTPITTLCLLLAACGGTAPTPAPAGGSAKPAIAANGMQQAASAVATTPDTEPATTQPVNNGAIAGTLIYPGEALPPMRICAFELAEGAPYCIDSAAAQSDYRIDDIPRGDYQVLVYPRDGSGAPGGYTGCVDDLSASCTAHDLRVVVVEADKTTRDIDPADFYAGDAAVDWPTEP